MSPKGSGRVLGLDLGDVRIGVAISAEDRSLAVPLGTVQVGRPPGELKAIRELVREHDVGLVVLGHPRLLSGARGSSAMHAEEFAQALRGVLAVPVVLQDERFSTVQAERALREAGATGSRARRVVDRSAATVILQGWLDAHRGA